MKPNPIRPELRATIAKITSMVTVMPADDTLGPPVTCLRCRDTRMIEYVAGTYTTPGDPGRRRGVKVTATERHPVYMQCECVRQTVDAGPAPRSRSFSAAG